MKNRINILIALITLTMYSCQNNIDGKAVGIKENFVMNEEELNEAILQTPKSLTPANYVSWVKNSKNGLKKKKKSGILFLAYCINQLNTLFVRIEKKKAFLQKN